MRKTTYWHKILHAILVALGCLACALYANTAAADNAAEISGIKTLYAQINRDIAHGKYKILHFYKVFPSEEWLLEEGDKAESGDSVVVYYRKGYVAKISTSFTVDSSWFDDYYFRENGMLFFHFQERWAHGWTPDGQEFLSPSEERHYVNARGRLIRHMLENFRTGPYGKKAGVESSENQMDMDADAKDAVDLFDVRDFEFYDKIRKYLSR